MHAFYRIQHNGEEIAAADTLEQARSIVRDSRPGSYTILEVRDTPGSPGQLMTRNWGQMIHPDDGPVVLDPLDVVRREACAMSVSSPEWPRIQSRKVEAPIRTILDPRFPQPGRYSEFGVPEVLRPAADLLYQALIECPEKSPDSQVIESALVRMMEPWSRP